MFDWEKKNDRKIYSMLLEQQARDKPQDGDKRGPLSAPNYEYNAHRCAYVYSTEYW